MKERMMEDQGNFLDYTACLLGRKEKQTPHMTAKYLQEGLAGSGVVVHHSTVQQRHTKNIYMEKAPEGSHTFKVLAKVNISSMRSNI